MNSDIGNLKIWPPIAASTLVITLVALFGATTLAVVVARGTPVGWAIWYYPFVAIVSIASSLALSGVAILVFASLVRKWYRWRLGGELVVVLSFLFIAFGIWMLFGTWLLTTSFVALNVVNAEAEEIFFRSWVELEPRLFIGAVFVATAVSALMLRSSSKYWAPVACIAAIIGTWELADLVLHSV